MGSTERKSLKTAVLDKVNTLYKSHFSNFL